MAQNIAIGVTAGGTAIREPSSVVTGSASYTIPAGFIAVVNVTQGISNFTVDSSVIIPADFIEVDLSTSVTHPHVAPAYNLYTNNTTETMYVTGNFVATSVGGPFQGNTGETGNKKLTIGTTVVGTDTSHLATSTITYNFTDIPLPAGESITTNNGWVSYAVGSNQQTHTLTASAPGAAISSSSMRLSLPAGTVIEGGAYIAETYKL